MAFPQHNSITKKTAECREDSWNFDGKLASIATTEYCLVWPGIKHPVLRISEYIPLPRKYSSTVLYTCPYQDLEVLISLVSLVLDRSYSETSFEEVFEGFFVDSPW